MPLLVLIFGAGVILISFAAILAFAMGGHWDMFKLGEESNPSTWFSSIQLSMIGLVLATIAVRDIERRRPQSWKLGLVPFFFFSLSLDEVAMLHERMGIWLQSAGYGTDWRTGPWMFVFLPLVGVVACAAAIAFWPYLRRRHTALALFVIGSAMFAVSAVGLEFAGNFVQGGSLIQKGLGFFEEVGEMVAGTLLLWGSLIVVGAEGIRLELGTSEDRVR